ncbi:MAG: hypothetical protein WDA08_08085 [Weeksellaceae bacterium]
MKSFVKIIIGILLVGTLFLLLGTYLKTDHSSFWILTYNHVLSLGMFIILIGLFLGGYCFHINSKKE